MIGSFNNCNIITLTQKATTIDSFEYIRQFSIDGISDNMYLLVQSGKYGVINTTETTKMEYCVIKFVSDVYTLQDDTICDGQISASGRLIVKSQYLRCMQ